MKTVLSSGNVLFSARAAPEASLERRAEAAMSDRLGRAFPTIVGTVEALHEIVDSDPCQDFDLAPGAKRVVTFLRDKPKARIRLPIELDGARILRQRGREIFSAYVWTPKGPVFMALIEKTFGKEVTTRTWETVTRLARTGTGS